ncbi:MAG: glycosyltransferase family 1 protein [Desulfobacteria bacterium]
MRILIDANPVIHGERAVQRNSRNLIDHLVKRESDIEYILFYYSWRGTRNSMIAIPTGRGHREFVCRLPGRLLEWSWRHYSWPAIESFVGAVDLVYGPDLVFPPARRAITMSTLHGIVYVAAPELTTPGHAEPLRRALDYAMRESDYYLAVSEQTKRDFMNYLNLPANRIRVSPHGVDPHMHRVEDRELVRSILRERFQLTKPYLLYVGALSSNKNILRLVEAFAFISTEFPDLTLVLAGPFENAYDEAVRSVREKGLENRVRFLGPVSPEGDDIMHLYNGAEVLIHPSLYEGWVAPPLEAMACGIPVVASNVSSIPETCGGAALLVDPLNIGSIAQGIRDVLDNLPLRQSLIERGFRRVKECQWSDSAARLEGIFRELIQSGQHHRRNYEKRTGKF